MLTIHAEQAVYGSFPFWSKGYGLLASSPECRAEWVREFETICQEFGEPTSGASGEGALLCKRLRRGPWLVMRVACQGDDDRGRPGALAFHGIFIPAAEFAKIAYDPFLISHAFQSNWSEALSLNALTINADQSQGCSQEWPLAAELLGRSVVIESATPIDDVAKAVWRALKPRERRINSFATLTFRAPLRFSLSAVPRIAEDVRASGAHILTRDEALQDARHLASESRAFVHEPIASFDLTHRRHKVRLVAQGLLLLGILAILGWWIASMREPTPSPQVETIAPPAPSPDDVRPVEPDERSRLVEGLIELGERFHVDMPASLDPTSLMRAIDRQLRYRGAWLSEKDRERIERESPRDREIVLVWDDHMQSFRSDRPLPRDFSERPLREQVALFAWSFRVPADPRQPIDELPRIMIETMGIDRSVMPSSVRARFPVLTEYQRFLSRLVAR